ncbi:MAG TPA: DUF4922 domain-containing protein [Blastocatellia bacterium]|nr:DUF4922 domain-containing protein [Blastocatellia bacterium]
MGWEQRIVRDEELRPYLSPAGQGEFRRRVSALVAQQQATWPMLREATAGLDQVEYRTLNVRESQVIAQFNPRRIVSTAAKVDAASIRERPCFLCPDSLPPEEKGIAFGGDFVILCNPFPVLRNHLVVAHREHTPQAIANCFSRLLDLAEQLGEDYFALYNGPGCGASAPDHLHFQACDRSLIPIVGDIEIGERNYIHSSDHLQLFSLHNYRLNLLIARGDDRDAIAGWFERAIGRLAEITQAQAEPMLNLVVMYGRGRWTVCFFPRGKHRPAYYFAEGEAKLTVSPAGIDLAGVLVVPEAAHFARITEENAGQIYAEVTLDDARFAELTTALR